MWPFKRKEWEKLGRSYSSAELFNVLNSGLKPLSIFLRDRDYRAISTEDFERIIFDCWFLHDEPAYKSEIFDCDDFSVCFMANVKTRWANISRGKEALSFGYISAEVKGLGFHAFIWHVNDKGEINFYEPQSGRRVNYELSNITLVET